MARFWTCQRQSKGVKCRARNPARFRKCVVCGKPRPARKKPAHLTALDLPYEHYMQLNGGAEQCGICGASRASKALHRDHDHRTGTPRGILCFRCNAALRPYMTYEWLLAATEYMRRARDRATSDAT